MLNGYSAYIFDIDGTILDTAPRILSSIKLSLEQSGVNVPYDKITKDLIGPKIVDILNILGISASSEQKDEIVKKFRSLYDNDPVSDTIIYPQALEIINQAKASQCPLFVATNKPMAPTIKVLKAFGLNFFKDVYCPNKYEDRILTKAKMLEEIITKNNLNASKVLMIGDTKGDLDAAKQTGCKFAFASWGYEKDKEVIEKLSDIVLRE